MVTYRLAQDTDAARIAALHAQSWQTHYAGIWTAAYLDGPVVADRLAVWQERFQQPRENQHIVIAEASHLLVGFACTYFNEEPLYGTLLDNLHVATQVQGQGIGKKLMQLAAEAALRQYPEAKFHLWVLEENHAARKFYERLGGENVETTSCENPDGTYSPACRYVWATAWIKG
jgi:ribosomal protein S18 acetylase RimI-like enzyme